MKTPSWSRAFLTRSLLLGTCVVGGSVAACSGGADSASIGAADEQALSTVKETFDLAALDRSTKPCDDFYQFACGGYLASVSPAPDEARHWPTTRSRP